MTAQHGLFDRHSIVSPRTLYMFRSRLLSVGLLALSDGNRAFVAKPICSLAAALVTFKAQPLFSHAPYFFIKLRIFFNEPSVF